MTGNNEVVTRMDYCTDALVGVIRSLQTGCVTNKQPEDANQNG